jgi:hypothetical protein
VVSGIFHTDSLHGIGAWLGRERGDGDCSSEHSLILAALNLVGSAQLGGVELESLELQA